MRADTWTRQVFRLGDDGDANLLVDILEAHGGLIVDSVANGSERFLVVDRAEDGQADGINELVRCFDNAAECVYRGIGTAEAHGQRT